MHQRQNRAEVQRSAYTRCADSYDYENRQVYRRKQDAFNA